ncbi:hypothetical protein Ahy_A08g041057 isoform A [Arachis hypogaea]|uniref:Uncharacterized protein n=1 Tax=Arachis hypogaea TaxID=3818 RepID=A0A445C1I9_ARAHY|nr:hypothetical protein Ahy_A08g041057 isoform A [Arachis hypogaea]
MKTKDRLLKLLDSEATLAEMFKYTHTLKENKEIFESYIQRLKATTQQSQQGGEDTANGSATVVVNPDAVWHETALAPNKNRIYEMRSFFASNLRTSTFKPSSGSATIRVVEPEEGVDLELADAVYRGLDGGVSSPNTAGINPVGGSSPAGGGSGPAGGSGPTVGGNSPAGGIRISLPSASPTRAMISCKGRRCNQNASGAITGRDDEEPTGIELEAAGITVE